MSFLQFPKNFMWGTATAAFQIEGAFNEDGKGESVWDRFNHKPGRILNEDNADIACDHYHRWEEDLKLMKDLGVNTYRFSISWPRIMPSGTLPVNQKGLDFYDRIIDKLLKYDIQPNITLNHWDLPQALEDRGGWINRESVQWFTDYAEVIFKKFGDRVPYWVTHNEPWVVAFLGYAFGVMAPGYQDFSKGFIATHHLLTAHANAVQMFRYLACSGKIGIVLNVSPAMPASNDEKDLAASERKNEMLNDLYLQPLVHGKYPEGLMKWMEPFEMPIEASDMSIIKGSFDFVGLNYYFSTKVKFDQNGGMLKQSDKHTSSSLYGSTEMGWGVYPQGLKDIIMQVKEKYGNPLMFVTENGTAALDEPNADGFVKDYGRIMYVRDHLRAVHEAHAEGANVGGYYIWSFMDNFEWAQGYDKRFGIVRVDYDTLKRTPKKSYYWYQDVIKANGLWE